MSNNVPRPVFLLAFATTAVLWGGACSRCAAITDELATTLRAEAARVGAGDLPDASGVPHAVYRFGPDLLDALALAIDPDRVVVGGIYRRAINQAEPDGLLVDGAAVVLSLQLALDSVAFEPDETTPLVRFRLVDRASRVALNVGSATEEWAAGGASIEVVAPLVFAAEDDDALIAADLSEATYDASGFTDGLPDEIAAVVDRLVRDALAETRSASEASVELIRLPPIAVAAARLPQRISEMRVVNAGLELTTVTPLRPVGEIDLQMPRGSGAVAHPDLARAAVEYALAVQTGLRRVSVDSRPAVLTLDLLLPVVGGLEGRGTLWCVEGESCRTTEFDVACTVTLDEGVARATCGADGGELSTRAPVAFETVIEDLVESLDASMAGESPIIPVALGIDATGFRVGWIPSAPP
jgi:hypothetical protein